MTFSEYFGQKGKIGRISLRRKQIEVLILSVLSVGSAVLNLNIPTSPSL